MPQYATGPTPVMVGSPSVGTPQLDQPMPQVPFRIATLERNDLIQVYVQAMTAATQLLEDTVPGTGFVYGLDLDYGAASASNAANVTFAEDGPYNAASTVIFRDVNGEIVDMPGWELKQAGRYGGWEPFNEESSLDPLVYSKTTGSGGTGGSFRFHTWVPIALNRRTLLGLLGNQDRGQAYILRSDLNAEASIYGTPPTNPPTVTINRHYWSYVVPNPANDQGQPQQVVPPFYGVIPYLTRSVSSNPPAGGQTTNHYLQRLNTTFRMLMLVLRSNGSRASAESNLPTNIALRIGNQTIFNELPAARRVEMYKRFGFDAPAGALVYDMLHDFGVQAGAELGEDWYWTQQLTEAQFQVTYPSGFGSSNNSLEIVTADMTVPAGMNLYAA